MVNPEEWEREGCVVVVDVEPDGTVQVAIEVLRQMLTDLGFHQTDKVSRRKQ